MGWGQPQQAPADVLHRRAGRADAAVLLVAKRIMPTMDLKDWGEALELDHRDLVAAVDRFKARMPAGAPAATRPDLRIVGSRNAGTREQRDAHMRQLRRDGHSVAKIAQHYGLTMQRVYQITNEA